MNPPDLPISPEPRPRRWPGIVLSFFVPGFGLIRAGRPARGLAWFFGLMFFGCGAVWAMVSPHVPLGLAIIWVLIVGLLNVLMLCDSFRPGRLSLRLGLLFAVWLVVLAVMPLPASLVGHSFRIPTEAMEPALYGEKHGTADQVFVNRLSYLFTPPRRGDIIVFATSSITGIPRSPEIKGEVYYVKRVVGLPGERIEIKDGAVFADGRKLGPADGLPHVQYVNLANATLLREGETYLVGPHEYFVLGDNSAHSFDSRFFGLVPAANLYGQVGRIYYPLSRIGTPR